MTYNFNSPAYKAAATKRRNNTDREIAQRAAATRASNNRPARLAALKAWETRRAQAS